VYGGGIPFSEEKHMTGLAEGESWIIKRRGPDVFEVTDELGFMRTVDGIELVEILDFQMGIVESIAQTAGALHCADCGEEIDGPAFCHGCAY